MKKILLVLFILFIFCSVGYAKRVIYYDKKTNCEITDISGVKTLKQIKAEFGDADYQVLEIDDGEHYKIDDGVLRKKTQEEKEAKKEKEKYKILISNEKERFVREQAIANLKASGELPTDYAE